MITLATTNPLRLLEVGRPSMGRPKLYHTEEERREARRASNKRWGDSPQGQAYRKEYWKKYRHTEAYARYREYQREYRKTDEYRAYQREYQSEFQKTDHAREYRKKYMAEYAKTDAYKQTRRRYLDKIKAQNLKKGLRSDGQPFATEGHHMRAKTGITQVEWHKRYRNGEIEWENLPNHVKKRIKPRDPNHASVRKSTGRTLQQWADQYGISREYARQLHKKWGTLTDDLFKNRSTSRSVEKRQQKAPETAVN